MFRLLTVALLFVSVLAAPAPASLSMYIGTEPLTTCELASDAGLITMCVVQWAYPQSTSRGARYRVSACSSTLVWLYSTSHFDGVSGDFTSGYEVDYGACLDGPVVVQILAFWGDGTSPPDAAIRLLPHADAVTGQVEGITCDGEAYVQEGGGICIKSTGACWCNYLGPPYHNIPCTEPVRVEATSWSRVKALYR
jgi:hypothetical protein